MHTLRRAFVVVGLLLVAAFLFGPHEMTAALGTLLAALQDGWDTFWTTDRIGW
jgi:hypothetical protein